MASVGIILFWVEQLKGTKSGAKDRRLGLATEWPNKHAAVFGMKTAACRVFWRRLERLEKAGGRDAFWYCVWSNVTTGS